MNYLNSLEIAGTLRNVWKFFSAVILTVTVSGILLPGDILLNSVPVCRSISAGGTECIACGLTREFENAGSGNLWEAGKYNSTGLPLYGLFMLNNAVFLYFTTKKLFIKITKKRGLT